MRIPTDSFSNSLIQDIQQINTQQSTIQQQLSTGLTITNPSDNPVVMGSVLSQSAEMQSLQQLSSNNTAATAIAQQSYSSLSSLNTISTSAGELAVQAGDGTTSAAANQANLAQINQYIQEGLQAANSQYNGNYLFGGAQTDKPPFSTTVDASGNITGVTYTGTASGASIPTAEGSVTSPYTDGAANQGIAHFLNNLIALRNGITAQDSSQIQTAQTDLQSSQDNLLTSVSGMSAVQSGLEADQTQNQAKFTSLQKSFSNETSTDVATASVKLTQAQTAYQAALASGAKIMQTSLLTYIT